MPFNRRKFIGSSLAAVYLAAAPFGAFAATHRKLSILFLGGTGQHNDELTLCGDRARIELAMQFAERALQALLVHFRKLPAYERLPLGPKYRDHIGETVCYPVHGLVDDQRAALGIESLQPLAAASRPRRREAFKAKPVGGYACGGQSCRYRTRARYR